MSIEMTRIKGHKPIVYMLSYQVMQNFKIRPLKMRGHCKFQSYSLAKRKILQDPKKGP